MIQDKGGEQQTSTAMRILAEVIASNAAWLVAFNKATDAVMEKNQKARENPKALATLDGYKRTLVNSLTGNLQRFGFERISRAETLKDIIAEMSEATGTVEEQAQPLQGKFVPGNLRASDSRGSAKSLDDRGNDGGRGNHR